MPAAHERSPLLSPKRKAGPLPRAPPEPPFLFATDDDGDESTEPSGDSAVEIAAAATDTLPALLCRDRCGCCTATHGNMTVLRGWPCSCVLGPWWPVCLFVTVPVVSAPWVFIVITAADSTLRDRALRGSATVAWLAVLWFLGRTGLRDPGMAPRRAVPPSAEWAWSDQARSFRAPGSIFSRDCNVVIEGYDHSCPWTGTAIGHRNLESFRYFVRAVAALFALCLVCGAARVLKH